MEAVSNCTHKLLCAVWRDGSIYARHMSAQQERLPKSYVFAKYENMELPVKTLAFLKMTNSSYEVCSKCGYIGKRT